MWNGSKLRPLAASPQFADESASQPLVPGTIARGELRTNDAMFTGRSGGKLVTKFPFPITLKVLERGQERFNIYCSPCHSKVGDGQGMIVKRGFPPPPDYGIVRLRQAPIGHFFDVMTHGYGAMFSYASRVSPNDRWAIAAYIRVLQSKRPVLKLDRRRVQWSRPEQMEPMQSPEPPNLKMTPPARLNGGNL